MEYLVYGCAKMEMSSIYFFRIKLVNFPKIVNYFFKINCKNQFLEYFLKSKKIEFMTRVFL